MPGSTSTPIHLRHGDVKDQQVRLPSTGAVDSFTAVARLADYLHHAGSLETPAHEIGRSSESSTRMAAAQGYAAVPSSCVYVVVTLCRVSEGLSSGHPATSSVTARWSRRAVLLALSL